MRLNGWQRLGVIASVCWAIGGGIWINSLLIDDMGAHVRDRYVSCLRAPHPEGPRAPPEATLGACHTAFLEDYPTAIANHGLYAAIDTAITIIIGWAAAYALLGLVRWVRRGFAQAN